jgi:AhpD family alkylhydroperoxidase
LDFRKASPQAAKAMSELHGFVHHCGLEKSLLELVKLRASQVNGCAHCIDMHTKELRADGESEQRLYLLNAWQKSPLYSDRERAALAWTEAVTLITNGHERGVHDGALAIQRARTGGFDDGNCGDQWGKPSQHRVPHSAGKLPAGGAAGSRISAAGQNLRSAVRDDAMGARQGDPSDVRRYCSMAGPLASP